MPAVENSGALLPLLARAWAINDRNPGAGEPWLRAARAGERGMRIWQKGPVPASTLDPDIVLVQSSYIESLRSTSAAARAYADGFFRRAAFHQRLLLATTAPTAAVPGEGRAAPVSRYVFNGETLMPATASTLVVPTTEMVRDTTAIAETLFNQEIAGALGEKLDAEFFNALVGSATDAPVITASGPSASNALFDLRGAMLQVNALGKPRPFWVLGENSAKMLASLASSDGVPVFAQTLGMTGGELFGAPAIVSGGIATDDIFLVEGSLVAANISAPSVVPGPSSDIEMADPATHDSITPTPTQLVSAFQANLMPFRGTVVYGALALRSNAICKIEGADYGNVTP
jgi:Phage capsid family